MQLKRTPEKELDVAELDRVGRELNWAYSEIGYVPLDRSVVTVALDKKERLYNETVDVVGRLANQPTPIDEASPDYARFWQLYRPELIGVESRSCRQDDLHRRGAEAAGRVEIAAQ